MINTENFKTKTIMVERQNPTKERWNIGLDVGYSSVKGFSPNSIYCFPAFAKKVPEGLVVVGKPKQTDIQYKSATGEIWNVGESAQDMSTTNDSELNVYGRVRWFSEMYKVISEVGMAFGMLKNKFGAPGEKELFVQMGLPPEYVKRGQADLIESLSGEHEFSIKIGSKDWIPFKFTLKPENMGVIDQPMGTLLSISTAYSGRPSADAARYFNSNVLILDAGFGTLDIYNISNGKIITKPETIDDLGMKQVFKYTIADIFDKGGPEITIPGMQNLLQCGKYKKFERKDGIPRSVEVPFADILEENNKKVCKEVIARVCNTYNNLVDHDYLIISGGTCAAWSNYIREYLAGMETLKILSGAQNDSLSSVFANVRGYYMYALNR